MTTSLRLPIDGDDGLFNAEAGPSKFAWPAVNPASTLDDVVTAIRQSKRMVVICGARIAERE
jgi:thiamine pyrophosphate-dependent acetolactate synthase large subunit-like protein